ncbi:MAG: FecR family protein [bacterium]
MLLLLLFAATALAAQQPAVVVEEVNGDVEIQLPGESWQSVSSGDIVPDDAKISTGFGASAVLAVGENADVTVRALTRIVINDLIAEEGIERSEMTLEIGRVSGEVRQSDTRRTEFQVRSPTATASVRGTNFDFDGEELVVQNGVVSFTTPSGREHQVGGGEETSSDGVTPPEPPSQGRAERGSVTHITASGSGGSTITTFEPSIPTGPATITIQWDFR